MPANLATRGPFFGIQLCCHCFLLFSFSAFAAEPVLKPASFSHYIDRFNSMEDENVTNFVSNADSWNWLSKEIPFFECPDHEVEEMYYFRWWSFRKHLEKTPNGFVFTEFLTRAAPVSSALGHHLMEGRWLHDQNYLDEYVRSWFHDDATRTKLHKFHSQWEADAAVSTLSRHGRQKISHRPTHRFDSRLRTMGTGTAHDQRLVLAIRRARCDGGIHQRLAHQ